MYEMLRSKSRHPKGGKKTNTTTIRGNIFTLSLAQPYWQHGKCCLHQCCIVPPAFMHISLMHIFQPVGGFRSPAGLLLLLPSPTGEEEGTLNPSLYLRQKGRGWAKCRLRASKWEEPTVTVDLSEQPPEQPPVTKDGSTSLTGLCLSLCLWFSSQFFFFISINSRG